MTQRINRSIALGLFALAGWIGAGSLVAQEPGSPETAPVVPIADTEFGLAKGSVFEVPVPPVPLVNATDPGDLPRAGRAFPGAPPRVPHAVADFMPITRSENWCIDCHVLDWAAPGDDDPTAIPVSHYVDLRGDTDEIGGKVIGARWVCVSCHLPQSEAPVLVNNLFRDGR